MTAFRRMNFPALTYVGEKLRRFDWEFLRTVHELYSNLSAILDRGIRFEDNVDAVLVTFTSSGTPDAENTVAHSLGKVPTGYIVYEQDKAGSVYKGPSAWTTSNIYLKCDVATVAVKILVF
ncbi:MAG: hypothetical protein HY548_09990 [Elusimicrobia bacterium]|nr:hypothetical protein [Elusimicrobiota bacterium]